MPAVATDLIYELIVTHIIGTTESSNILGYFNDDPTPADPAADDLISGFLGDIIPAWTALINSRVSVIEISARRLNNITDFSTQTLSTPGARVGDSSTNFAAFKVNKNRLTKETRSGWMNIMGVSEDDTSPSGQVLEAASLARLNTLAVALQTELTPTVNRFKPVIIGNRYNYATTPPTLNPEASWVYNLIQTITSAPKVTSQVSRK